MTTTNEDGIVPTLESYQQVGKFLVILHILNLIKADTRMASATVSVKLLMGSDYWKKLNARSIP